MKIDIRDSWTVFTARRGAGKTTLIQWMIKHNRSHFREVFVISPSAFSGAWQGIVPESNVIQNWSEEWLMSLIKKMMEKNKGKKQKDKDFTRVLVVLDDVLSSETKAHNSKALNILASRGRHCGISCLLSIHYLTSIAPLHRNMATYILFGVNNQASIEILFDEYNIGDMNAKQFSKFVRDNTQQYRFLVINCEAANTNDPSEVYGTIKAPSE